MVRAEGGSWGGGQDCSITKFLAYIYMDKLKKKDISPLLHRSMHGFVCSHLFLKWTKKGFPDIRLTFVEENKNETFFFFAHFKKRCKHTNHCMNRWKSGKMSLKFCFVWNLYQFLWIWKFYAWAIIDLVTLEKSKRKTNRAKCWFGREIQGFLLCAFWCI